MSLASLILCVISVFTHILDQCCPLLTQSKARSIKLLSISHYHERKRSIFEYWQFVTITEFLFCQSNERSRENSVVILLDSFKWNTSNIDSFTKPFFNLAFFTFANIRKLVHCAFLKFLSCLSLAIPPKYCGIPFSSVTANLFVTNRPKACNSLLTIENFKIIIGSYFVKIN